MALTDLLISEYVEGSSNNKAIELFNGTNAAIDLTGYSLEFYFNGSTSAGTRINLVGAIAPGDVFVLADNDAAQSILDVASQTSTSNFFNGDDAIVLQKNGVVIDSIGQIGFDPGSEWGSGDPSTQNNTLRRKALLEGGDTDPNDAFDPTSEWFGFPQDTFDGLGSNVDEGEPQMVAAAIYEIQGEGHISPLIGQQVKTIGIVTAIDSNGFYLQDAQGDDSLATSDAIFVFTRTRPSLAVGDELEVQGSVSEFIPGGADTGNLSTTQITSAAIATLSTGNALPSAVVLGRDGRVPPNQVIDNDQTSRYDVLAGEGTYEPTQDGLDFYESLEAMRVQVQDAVAVSPTNRFGEIFTLANRGKDATGLSQRGTVNISPEDFNPERIQIQFDSGILPGFEQVVDVGAQLGDVTGVLGYNFGNFEVNVTEAFTVEQDSTLKREQTQVSQGSTRLTVASYNVLNLDPNDNDGDRDVANGQFDAIADHIVNNLKLPDIIGLQEIQDNDGSVNSDIKSADQTLQLLIDEIAERGGVTYQFIDNPLIGDDTNGGQPGGNIRTAFLYNPERVDLVEDSVRTVTDPQAQQTDPNNPFFNSRLPLAATFQFNGEAVTIVNNHFSSKGGSAPLLGRFQPAVELQDDPGAGINGSLDERIAQAQAVQTFVADILNRNANANVIALGDFNEFEFLPPLEILEQSLVNLTETLPPDERYSYIFQGNSQSLDHILASGNLSRQAQFDAVHVNSEFSDQASDHDPLIASFFLGGLGSGDRIDRLTGLVQDYLTTGSDRLNDFMGDRFPVLGQLDRDQMISNLTGSIRDADFDALGDRALQALGMAENYFGNADPLYQSALNFLNEAIAAETSAF